MINPYEYSILIVEDSAIQAEMLRRALDAEGYRVLVAGNGAKALEMTRTAKPSLIISDVSMPIMDGYQMCHEIKSDSQLWDIPVILLTDLSDPKDVIRGLNAKADNYVTKPWNDKLLLSRIESLLENPQKFDDASRSEPVELNYGGESYLLTSGPTQILNLLISTYENAVQQRRELVDAQHNLVTTNDELDAKLRALRESEGRFEVLVQMIPDIVYRIDTRGRFTFVNNAVSLIGYKPNDLIGKHFSEIILPADIESVSSDHVIPKYRGKITGPEGAPKLFDERRTGDRVTRNLEVRLVRNNFQDTRPAIVESIGTEVVSVEISSSGMYEFTSEGTPGDLLGTIGVAVDKQPHRYIGTVGAIRDVTDRKRTEAALLRSEERFRLLVQTAGSAIILLSPDNLVLEWNHEAEIVFGHDRDSVLSKDFLDLFTIEEQKTLMHDALQKTMAGDEVRDLETLITTPDTGWFSILWNMSLLFDKDANPVAIIAVGQDVTQWKNAEEERLNAKAEAEMARISAKVATDTIDGMLDAVVLIGADGAIMQLNKGFTDSTGWGQEVIGTSLTEYMSDDDTIAIKEVFVSCFSDRVCAKNIECKMTTKDNKEIPMLLNATAMNDSYEKPLKIIAVLRDIAERKRLEEKRQEVDRKLLHAQKLESLNMMAGGIAHDFNNHLAAVLGNLELALMDQALDHNTRKKIENAVTAAKRSAELSGQMLIYSGSAFYIPRNLDINEVAQTKEDALKSLVPKTTTLHFEINKVLPSINGDVDLIQRVITNLVINASEAIGDMDGDVTISTGVMDCDEAYLRRSRLEEKPKPGRFVFLEISDTGCGMDDDTQRRAFDPFFSTKFWGRGLGMAEVLGIVKCHHGAIIIDSQVGKGSTIRVLFSTSEKVEASSVNVKPVLEPKSLTHDSVDGRKTILVVDDDELVRDYTAEFLELLGFDPITARDGAEGVRIFRERLNDIDLVLLDFAMPNMDGVEAYHELIRIKPDARIMICSGYAEDAVIERFPDERPASFLHKPYDMQDLKGEINRLLGTTA